MHIIITFLASALCCICNDLLNKAFLSFKYPSLKEKYIANRIGFAHNNLEAYVFHLLQSVWVVQVYPWGEKYVTWLTFHPFNDWFFF